MLVKRSLFLLAALLALLPFGCAENPVSGKQNFVLMSEQDEINAGRKADQEVREEYSNYDAPALQAYVNRIGQRLAASSHRPNLNYKFSVVDSPEVNAFALPGGYVYITRGIMAYLNSEAELAAVVGHELGHVTARHSVRQMSASTAANLGVMLAGILVPELGGQAGQQLLGGLGQALLSGYGRDHELEADRLGAEYLARTGYDPEAMIEVIGVLKNQELFDAEIAKAEGRQPRRYHGLFATHPDNDTRLKQVVGEAKKYQYQTTGEGNSGREEFLRLSEGMVVGDSVEQGVVRANLLKHPGLGFGVQFPRNWKVSNKPARVTSASPAGDMVIEMVAGKPRGSPEEVLRRVVKTDAGARMERLTVNTLPAAALAGSSQGRPLYAAAIHKGDQAFILLGLAKNATLKNTLRDAFSGTLRSFRQLDPDEKAAVRPHRIHLIQARPGMTMASLAAGSPLGRHAESYLRLMNGLYPSGEPKAGQPLKIVE
jgi:predicted Zn-dependent protease